MHRNDKLSYATLQLTTHNIAKPSCMRYTVTCHYDTFCFLIIRGYPLSLIRSASHGHQILSIFYRCNFITNISDVLVVYSLHY